MPRKPRLQIQTRAENAGRYMLKHKGESFNTLGDDYVVSTQIVSKY